MRSRRWRAIQFTRLCCALFMLAPMALVAQDTPPSDTPEHAEVPAEPGIPDADTLMRHIDELYRADSSRARMTMEIVTSDFSRTLEMEAWSVGANESLVVVRSPAREAGTATLRNADGLWNYAPRADRLMRIPSGMMSDGWMGSHLTNDDMVRDTQYEEDYTTTVERVTRDGRPLLRAMSIPGERTAVAWTRVDFYVDEDGWVPVLSEFFDNDEIVRRIEFSEVTMIDGRSIPLTMTVVPGSAPDEYTRMRYTSLELDVSVDRDLFTQRGLRRAATQR